MGAYRECCIDRVLHRRAKDVPLATTVDEVRFALRAAGTSEAWRAMYDESLSSAVRDRDLATVAELTTFAAIALEAVGRHQEAIAQLEYGIGASEDDLAQRAHLLAIKASFLAFAGNSGEAHACIREARAVAAVSETERASIEVDIYDLMIRCVCLDAVDLGRVQQTVGRAERAGLPWLSAGLLAWVIPWTFANGRVTELGAWVDAFRARATAQQHRRRLEDLETFERARLALSSVPAPEPLLESARARLNREHAWRTSTLGMWASLHPGALDLVGP